MDIGLQLGLGFFKVKMLENGTVLAAYFDPSWSKNFVVVLAALGNKLCERGPTENAILGILNSGENKSVYLQRLAASCNH